MKIRDNKVANVAIEVEAPANFGILSMELLIMMKLILVNTANTMANINFQLKINLRMLSMFNKLPEINERSPRSTIENVLAKQ